MLKVKNRVTGPAVDSARTGNFGGERRRLPVAMASLPRELSLAFCVACCDIALSLSPGRPTSRCPWRPGL